MPLHNDLKEAINKITADSKLFHDIVHGGEASTVATEGGAVKTVAKAIGDIEAELAEHIAAVERAASDVRALQEKTQAAEISAKQALTQALQTVGAVKASSTDQHPGSLKDKLAAGTGVETALKQMNNQEFLELNVAPTLDTSAKLYLSAHFI
jgi:hypothetical protein